MNGNFDYVSRAPHSIARGKAVFRKNPQDGNCSPVLRNGYKRPVPSAGTGRGRVSGRGRGSGNPGYFRGRVSGVHNARYVRDHDRNLNRAAEASDDLRELLLRKKLIAKLKGKQVKPPSPTEQYRREIVDEITTSPADDRSTKSTLDTSVTGDEAVQKPARHDKEVLHRKKPIAKLNDKQVKPPSPTEQYRREIVDEIITSPAVERSAKSTLDTSVTGDKAAQKPARHDMQLSVHVTGQVNAAAPVESDNLAADAAAAVVPPVIDRHDLLMAFVGKTLMNIIYSNMCLEQFNWDFDSAYQAFQISFNIGNIPDEAFIW